jgi:hypothetical protein
MKQDVNSCSISLGFEQNSIWMNNFLYFKKDNEFYRLHKLRIKQRELELIKYLPSDIILGFGFNNPKPEFWLSAYNDESGYDEIMPYVQNKDELFSCFGDEGAFSILMQSDKFIPRMLFIADVTDENKIHRIMEIVSNNLYKYPEYFSVKKGSTVEYHDTQISNYQIDLTKVANYIPELSKIIPKTDTFWYSFIEGKVIFVISQSPDAIRRIIDNIKSKKFYKSTPSIFEKMDAHLPKNRSAILYISTEGSISLVKNMISQVEKNIPFVNAEESTKPRLSIALSTTFDVEGLYNFLYLDLEGTDKLINDMLNLNHKLDTIELD